MKIYHKFLLYQNKWIYPYVRVALRVMTTLTYLASILLIVGLVYEHGFRISAAGSPPVAALVSWGVDCFLGGHILAHCVGV